MCFVSLLHSDVPIRANMYNTRQRSRQIDGGR